MKTNNNKKAAQNKIKFIFGTSKHNRKHMFDELINDGWRWNKDGEFRHYVGGFMLIKEFKDNKEAMEYFNKKYPKFHCGCSCDECNGDYELEQWSDILHAPNIK